jgi:hypothetical membrane protein
MPRSRVDRRTSTLCFLYLGGAIPVVFASTLVVCGLRLGHYNHLSRLVSELGALGTPTQHMFSAGLLVCASLSVFFVVGLTRACTTLGISPIPPALVLLFSVSIAGAGIFPLPMRMHFISGSPSALLFLSPLLALLLWPTSLQLPWMRPLAWVSLVVMLLGFLAFLPGALQPYPGLKQRFFHAGWAIWFVSLSYQFSRPVRVASLPPDATGAANNALQRTRFARR